METTTLQRPRRSLSRTISKVLLPFILAVLAFSILYPLAALVISGFVQEGKLTGQAFSNALNIPGLGQAIINTIILVVVSTVISAVVGFLLAWFNEKTDARIPGFSGAVPVLPLLVSPIAGSLGYVFLFSPEAGLVNTLLMRAPEWATFFLPDRINIYTAAGVIFVNSLYLVPNVYVIAAAALRNIDGSQEEASRIFGDSPARTLVNVVIPNLRTPLITGSLLAMITSIAMFTIPIILGTRAQFDVLSIVIYKQLQMHFPPQLGEAVVLSILMLAAVQMGLLVEVFAMRKTANQGVASRITRTTVTELGAWKWAGRIITFGYMLSGTLLPVIGLFYVTLQKFWSPNFRLADASFDSYRQLLSQLAVREAAINSTLLGIGGATIVILGAALITWFLRDARPSIKQFANAITGLPASVPHTVFGIAFLISFGTGFFKLSGTLFILLLAYVVMYTPHAFRSVNAANSQMGKEVIEASSMSGASEIGTFFRIVLPLTLGGLISGWVLVFVLMFNEVTASVFLAKSSSSVIGPYIIDLWLNIGNYPLLGALALMLSVLNSVIVLGMLAFSRRTSMKYRS